ncbi:glycoside hydrolase family 88/105 protein [Simiduia agarivorans]|uniref:Glycosyl hydrolase family 88 n=1 Tax=Simiduia agarivorans (strain DSM 21679 / JCM 13881 / BCRC 17597 / SA1) TaxID=1117647 RepID=K4KKQ7_SIMAS|nr:glycoside hydrolase family 88 protein [Simiduia agarivorans]AFU98805.1 hypothetical protein M5M_08080 [Simiduia agarivorans SA1 = DSM 21679]
MFNKFALAGISLAIALQGCGNAEAPSAPDTHAGPDAAHASSAAEWPVPVSYQLPGTSPAELSPALTPAAIRQVANQVADWQLSQYDLRSNMMRAEGRPSGIPQGWMYATWQIGLLAWADASAQPAYESAAYHASAANGWLLGPRVYHADDHAMGAVYMSLYERAPVEHKIAHTRQMLDAVLAAPSDIDLLFDDDNKTTELLAHRDFIDPACTVRWCWADAIFMAPPVWAQMAKITGNAAYLDFMDREFWATTEYLYKPEEKLYLRDSRYFDRLDDQGRLIYWGRGNGWVLAGIARTLQQLPQDYAGRARYEQLFKDMSERLVALQQQDGSWPSSLLVTETVSPPESSGTGLLVYALAWGVNTGLLEGDVYRASVEQGWRSLVASTHPNGKLGWVQQVAFAPGSAGADDTQLYGTGALLLAASEVTRLAAEASGNE